MEIYGLMKLFDGEERRNIEFSVGTKKTWQKERKKRKRMTKKGGKREKC